MKQFKHINVDSIEEAVSILKEAKEKVSVIAGGTDLLGGLKGKIHESYPDLVLNIKNIPDMEYIKDDDEYIKIGALTKLYKIANNKLLNDKYTALSEAAKSVASPEIRNMATIGGNICQDNRCWYYRNECKLIDCTRKGGEYCYALTGQNQFHSVFGAIKIKDSLCRLNCPTSLNIPLYMSKIRENNISGAARVIMKNNPIPAITGRVCPHPCEDHCNRGEFDYNIPIQAVERFMGDYILENMEEIVEKPVKENGLKVAIIGSGPAGLSAAYYLRQYGYAVTVFEKMEKCGGVLTYGIPAYRLPKNVVESVIKSFKNIGIDFKTKMEVGKDILFERLKKDFKSIFIATGAWKQPSIGLEGEEYTKSGLEFLTNIILGYKESLVKKVVVIGGGNVACDVSCSALRLGAEEVTMVCLERPEEMPALEYEKEHSIEEGVKIMNSWGPRKVLITEEGKVKGIELVKCVSIFDENGHFSPVFDSSTKKTIEADQIYMAIGQKADISFIDHSLGLKLLHGFIQIDGENQQTNIEGLFAGGDVTSGPATVVKAICSGRESADAINKYLSGKEKTKGKEEIFPLRFNASYLRKMEKVQIKEIPIDNRKINVEDVYGLSQIKVEEIANRCFNCGCVAVNCSDIAIVLLVLDAKIKTNKRVLNAKDFFIPKLLKSVALDDDELVLEIKIPKNKNFNKSKYKKFRIRKAIDFPIVSVAANIKIKEKKVKDVRITLGAVAPIPLRLREVETFLKGKEIDEKVAKEAADISVKNTIPLMENGYKVQIIKALVRRIIIDII